jgi:hypothetical protein
VEAFTELMGTMIFALLGGVADPNGTGRDGCGCFRLSSPLGRMTA